MKDKTSKLTKRQVIERACETLETTPIINPDAIMSLAITEDPCADLRIAKTALELSIIYDEQVLSVKRITLMLVESALAECELNQDPGLPPPVDP